MSVLLTASKASIKAKIVKKKKKIKPQPRCFDQTPPTSTPQNKVWHWELSGMPTTIMYSVNTNELWCNGENLEWADGFEADSGGYMDFSLFTPDDVIHTGRIHRVSSAAGLVYQLYVDGYPIMEHTNEQAEEYGAHAQYVNIPSTQQAPPSYDQVVAEDVEYGEQGQPNHNNHDNEADPDEDDDDDDDDDADIDWMDATKRKKDQ